MPTIKQWEQEIESLSKEQASVFKKSLGNLMGWDFFRKGFEGFGLTTVGVILSTSIVEKKRRQQGEKIFEGYTREELQAALNAVTDPDDWRAPINKRIRINKIDVTLSAIRFFTGTSPRFTPEIGETHVTVASEGYRQGPAGDH